MRDGRTVDSRTDQIGSLFLSADGESIVTILRAEDDDEGRNCVVR